MLFTSCDIKSCFTLLITIPHHNSIHIISTLLRIILGLSSIKQCRWLSSVYLASNNAVDWAKVSRPTRHKVSYLGDVLPSQSLGIVLYCWLLGLLICVCIALCTTVVHNTAQNRFSLLPSRQSPLLKCYLFDKRGQTLPNTTQRYTSVYNCIRNTNSNTITAIKTAKKI